MLILEPDASIHETNSQFGCVTQNEEANFTISPGLSRLVTHPDWLSGKCTIPKCYRCYDNEMIPHTNYSFWSQIAEEKNSLRGSDHEDWKPVNCCSTPGGNNISILPIGGDIRYMMWANGRALEKSIIFEAHEWVGRIGATTSEIEWFRKNSHLNESYLLDQVSALISRAGLIEFQAHIAHNVRQLLEKIDLPDRYAGFHVRRGDKLIAEQRHHVQQYWFNLGYNETTQPLNYIPFIEYARKMEAEVKAGALMDIYIATTDIETVATEVDALPSMYSGVTFHLNSDNVTANHLNIDDNCERRYRRTITAIAELMILSRSDSFVGEYNSNFGRLIHTARSSFQGLGIGTAAQLDMRIVFGGTDRGVPGT